MIGTLILTHGGMARELLEAARKINGSLAQFEAISLSWSATMDDARRRVEESLDRLNTGEGVLILTDAFGGTPCNIAMSFRAPGVVEVIGGVNLPMVMRLACLGNLREETLDEAAHWLAEKGQQSICVGSDREAACAPPPCPQTDDDRAQVKEHGEAGKKA
ncbi:MAG: PTS sugar transporter subunit IIA [Acidobacteriota bacterium]